MRRRYLLSELPSYMSLQNATCFGLNDQSLCYTIKLHVKCNSEHCVVFFVNFFGISDHDISIRIIFKHAK